MEEPRQLWIVTDEDKNWLYCARGNQAEAVEGAKKAEAYNPEDTLYLFAVAMEIVIEPVAV